MKRSAALILVAMTDESTLVYSANQAPVFSGNSDDLEEWILEVELWQFTTSLKEEKLAAKLITSQHDAMTKKAMLRVPKDPSSRRKASRTCLPA